MILLKKDKLVADCTWKDILMCGTKKDILQVYELANLTEGKSKYTKEQLANALQLFFEKSSSYIINQLPEAEQKLLSQLLVMKQEEYVVAPRNNEEHLMMQGLHLVLTYETGDAWHLYMPDSIRNTIVKHIEQDTDNTPGMREFQNVMDVLTGCNDRLYAAMNDESGKSHEEIVKEVAQIKADYKKYLKELKSQEKQVKSFCADLEKVYSMTEEQMKLCDLVIEAAPSIDPKQSKEEKMFDDLALMMAAKKEQEMEDVMKNEGKPIDFAPALSGMLPLAHKGINGISVKLVRSAVMELTVQMTEAVHMVCYITRESDGFRVACRWGDVLNFVWNGVEEENYAWSHAFVIKKHFMKKYPAIASLFGQKTDRNGKQLPLPYITTIGMDHQPKEWWLSVKLADATDEDFANWYIGGLLEDDYMMDAIEDLRDACVVIYNEIGRSDAKQPKELMYSFFGKFELRKAGLVEL